VGNLKLFATPNNDNYQNKISKCNPGYRKGTSTLLCVCVVATAADHEASNLGQPTMTEWDALRVFASATQEPPGATDYSHGQRKCGI